MPLLRLQGLSVRVWRKYEDFIKELSGNREQYGEQHVCAALPGLLRVHSTGWD